MTAKSPNRKVTIGIKAADELVERGVRGVLLQMAKSGQIIELRCEMPKCYCQQGAGALRTEIDSPFGLGALPGPLSQAEVRWRTPRPLECPALPRALQSRRLWLAYED